MVLSVTDAELCRSLPPSRGSERPMAALVRTVWGQMDQPGFDLGARLKALRESHDLSQRELAKRAGVSNAIISMIEQNRSSPSVGLLKKLLDGFPLPSPNSSPPTEAPPADLLRRDRAGRARRRPGLLSTRSAATSPARRCRSCTSITAPGADTGEQMLTHDAEEGGVIIRGKLEVTVGDQVRVLGPGDAYYFDSRTPHRFRNVGDGGVRSRSRSTRRRVFRPPRGTERWVAALQLRSPAPPTAECCLTCRGVSCSSKFPICSWLGLRL